MLFLLLTQVSEYVVAADADALEVFFYALEFNADPSVVSVHFESIKCSRYVYVTMTEDSAAEVVATTCFMPAFTGIVYAALLEMIILTVSVSCISCELTNAVRGIFINVKEVTHIKHNSEVFVVYCVNESFNNSRLVEEVTVVFDRCLDAKRSRIFCDSASTVCKHVENFVKALTKLSTGHTVNNVMSEHGGADESSLVNVSNSGIYYLVKVLATVHKEVLINKVRNDGKVELL